MMEKKYCPLRCNLTSNDDPLTGILMHFTDKEEMPFANITLRDFVQTVIGDCHALLLAIVMPC